MTQTHQRPLVHASAPSPSSTASAWGSTATHMCGTQVTDGVFMPGSDSPDGPPAFLPTRPITQADLVTLTEQVRRPAIRWFKRQGFLDSQAATDLLAWEKSGFSIDASVRITLIDRDFFPTGCPNRERGVDVRHPNPLRTTPTRADLIPPAAATTSGWLRVSPSPCPIHTTTAGRSRPTSNRRFASGRRPGWLRPRKAEPPPVSSARGPPTDWAELVQAHDDRDIFQVTDRRAACNRHPRAVRAGVISRPMARPGKGLRRVRKKALGRGGEAARPD